MTKRFEELINEILELYRAKNNDYNSNKENGYENFMQCEKIGLPAWKGVIVRLTDKWSRILTLAGGKEQKVKSESIKDTLRDNAVYSLICIELLEREEAKEKLHHAVKINNNANYGLAVNDINNNGWNTILAYKHNRFLANNNVNK